MDNTEWKCNRCGTSMLTEGNCCMKCASVLINLMRNELSQARERERAIADKLVKATDREQVLVEALSFYANEDSMKSLTGLPYGRRAREALAKWREMGGKG